MASAVWANLGFTKMLQPPPLTHMVRKPLAAKAEPCGQLDPQPLVAQSIGVLFGSPSLIAGKLPWSFGSKDIPMAEMPIASMNDAFHAVFVVPFASHEWQSARGRSHWVDLEGWQDSMAGPLSSIAKSGGCEYVYHRTDGYFLKVVEPDSLLRCLLDSHAGLVAGIKAFSPTNPAEAEDERYMKALAEEMSVLVERGCEIERARWAAESR